MTDWYNDPPEDYDDSDQPEDGYCGEDPQPDDFDTPDLPPRLPQDFYCPHNILWEDCNDCMIAADLAFDAARERGR